MRALLVLVMFLLLASFAVPAQDQTREPSTADDMGTTVDDSKNNVRVVIKDGEIFKNTL